MIGAMAAPMANVEDCTHTFWLRFERVYVASKNQMTAIMGINATSIHTQRTQTFLT